MYIDISLFCCVVIVVVYLLNHDLRHPSNGQSYLVVKDVRLSTTLMSDYIIIYNTVLKLLMVGHMQIKNYYDP